MSRKQVIDFWSGNNLDHAKALIVDRPRSEWDAETEKTIPLIVPPVVLDNLPGRHVCLEIGAGIGRLLKSLTNYFDIALGVDISPKMVEYSWDYLANTPNAKVYPTDGTSLPQSSGSVDFVFSYICFQHLQSYAEVQNYLRESFRVLKPGGVIRVQTHCGEPNVFFDGMHGAYYRSLDEFTLEFCHAGFSLLEHERGITHPDSLWVTAQKGLKNA
jgi:SAM-dependent methyltransferase